jgi:hypothetical protein
MTQHYSDPARATDPHALPDVEVFYITETDVAEKEISGESFTEPGWYWWHCFPGCLPDGEAIGPFETEADAVADMRMISAVM